MLIAQKLKTITGLQDEAVANIALFHAGIDGYSRLVTYIRWSNNNCASTVLHLFVEAVSEFGVPSRVRSDQGVENVGVTRWMLTYMGVNRGSIITGSSVHNQRIERLWRDVRSTMIQTYRNIFYYMENQQLLDPDNDLHLYCLQSVYIPRINKSLLEFREQYNHHPLRTANNRSPYQLFLEGMIMNRHSDHTAVSNFFSASIIDINVYGVEEEGPTPSPIEDNGIIVNSPHIQLSVEEETEFVRVTSSVSEDFGISQNIQGLDMLRTWGY